MPAHTALHPLLTRLSREAQGWLFMAPAVAVIGVFLIASGLFALYLSFTDYNALRAPHFIGLANYRRILADPIAVRCFLNTVKYVVMFVPANLVLALAVALLLSRPVRGIRIIRTVYFIPVVISSVVVVSIFKAVFEFKFGVANYLLQMAHLEPVPWYSDRHWALFTIALLGLWKSVPFNSIIFLAGLQDVPGELLDAARVDGANAWGRFRHVIVPYLRPVITFVLVLSTIGAFRVFTEMFVLTKGGPENSTRTISLYAYNTAFTYWNMGYASALSFVLMGIVLVIALVQLRVSRTE
jgi:multiple sugar transport system permease protein